MPVIPKVIPIILILALGIVRKPKVCGGYYFNVSWHTPHWPAYPRHEIGTPQQRAAPRRLAPLTPSARAMLDNLGNSTLLRVKKTVYTRPVNACKLLTVFLYPQKYIVSQIIWSMPNPGEDPRILVFGQKHAKL